MTIKDPGAHGLIVVQGSGHIGKTEVDSPNFIRYGQMTADEVFVTAKRAGEGVNFKNTGSEPFVSLRYWGPDVHKDLPKVGDYLTGGRTFAPSPPRREGVPAKSARSTAERTPSSPQRAHSQPPASI